jgi:hypothetical protein
MTEAEQLRERIRARNAQFDVGDTVNFILDANEYEGKIVSIKDADECLVETRWGQFTAKLSLCRKIAE